MIFLGVAAATAATVDYDIVNDVVDSSIRPSVGRQVGGSFGRSVRLSIREFVSLSQTMGRQSANVGKTRRFKETYLPPIVWKRHKNCE